jgi:hypothetical protein
MIHICSTTQILSLPVWQSIHHHQPVGWFSWGKASINKLQGAPPNNKMVYKFINPLTMDITLINPLALGLICTNLANKSI